jgi:exonuclease III
MTDIYKVATLNINGLMSHLRIAMLEDFLIKHEIDILFLQEVTQPVFENL